MHTLTAAPTGVSFTQARVLRLLAITERTVYRDGHFIHLSLPGDSSTDRFPAATVDALIRSGLACERGGVLRLA